MVTTLIGVSSADGITPVTIYVDPSTHRVLTQTAAGSGTVTDFIFTNANGISGSVLTSTTTPTLTLTLGAITPTSVNGLTITSSTGTLTIAAAKTLTVSNTMTFTATDGSTIAFGAGGTVAYVANKLSVFAATTSAELRTVISDESGTGLLVFNDTPTLITPILGVATATSINGLIITTTTGTLTLTNGKTLTVQNTLTFSGTDASSVAFGAGGTVAYLGTAQTFTALNTYSFAGLPVRIVNTADAASNQGLKVESDRATVTANDEVYVSLILSDSAGNQDEFGRITMRGTTVTSTTEAGRMAFSVITAGALAEELYLTGTAFSPAANDGNALGTTTLMWADLFLATGGVINFNNGDVTITHSADTLAFAGGAYTFAGAVSPAANDGSALGTTALQWSDIFLAEGAVINFDNGDLTLTQAGNTLTLAGGELILPTDGPTSTLTAGFRGVPQNSKSAAYTTVLADAGHHILHPTADANARTFTIDSNANVAYPIGTAITFVNQTSQVVTIAITTDTMTLAGTTTTGSRSLAQNGVATALKITATAWIISGTGLT